MSLESLIMCLILDTTDTYAVIIIKIGNRLYDSNIQSVQQSLIFTDTYFPSQ